MNRLIAISGTVILALAQAQAQSGDASKYSQKTLLKSWALSRCLGQVYSDPKTKEDANATASAYLEFGRQPVEAYDVLSELVNKYANQRYTGSVKSEFNTMKCIDLFHSRELEELTGRLSKGK
jgi:hypothetical protein